MGELKRTFKPEFLNRVDEIIVFHQLNKDNITEIASRMLEQLRVRLLNLDITVDFTPEAVAKIADAGFDIVYGARPLRRAIQSKIEDRLSELMLEGAVCANRHYVCRSDGEEFVFTEKESA